MKILIVAATPFFSSRGCHLRIHNKAKYLGRSGALIRIVTYPLGDDIDGLDVKRTSGSFYQKTGPGFSWGKIYLDWKLFFLTIREIRKFKPDIIYGQLLEGIAIGHLARKMIFCKVPLLGDIQGDLKEEFKKYNPGLSKIVVAVFSSFVKRVINWADFIVYSSSNSEQFVKDNFFQRNKIALIEDGLDREIFENREGASISDQAKIDIDRIDSMKKSGGKVLFYGGGIEASKGIEALLENFFKLLKKKDFFNWRMVIFGSGALRDRLRTRVESLSLEENVYFCQSKKYFDLPLVLTKADVAIDPKDFSSEGSGKLMTYVLAGLPIVCFDNLFNRSILGYNGFYLKDWSELAKRLQEIGNRKMEYQLSFLEEKKIAKKLQAIMLQEIKS